MSDRPSPRASPRARKRFGQHFLAPAWADKVVQAIAPSRDDRFLEIGPGLGALTARLASRVAHVTAVEVDRGLAEELRPHLPSNVDLVVADILDVDLGPFLAPGPLRVAGNLPYNISSPILFKLLAAARMTPGSDRPGLRGLVDATVMLQLEVAERLAAVPGTKDYGVLTIFTTAQADVRRLLTLPPGAFRPAPKVHSAVVRITFKPPVIPHGSEAAFEGMVRTMFMQRRKTLLNALRPYAESAGRTSGAVLAAAGIDPVRRPETLTLPDLVRLVSVFSHGAVSPEP
jgi:16S rRNA (adenine1518-N6/adenine1519-N6)-dimethyltransferase